VTKDDIVGAIKQLNDIKASLRLSINQSQNTVAVAKECIERFEKMSLEFKAKIEEYWTLDIQPLDEFKKLRSNYLNLKDYLRLQSNKALSALNEQHHFEHELYKVEREIESLEGISGKRGQVYPFKNEQKEES
jgi:predicted  nucleic acid-binding Zn-ribbon protein